MRARGLPANRCPLFACLSLRGSRDLTQWYSWAVAPYRFSVSFTLSHRLRIVMLELSVLKPEQLRLVHKWDGTAEPFEDYEHRMTRPHWAHYAINAHAIAIGCVSLELIDPKTCSLHLSMRPKTALLRELQRLLFDVAAILFAGAIRTIICEIHPTNRAARLLAVSCGMNPAGQDERCLYFALTAEDYQLPTTKSENRL